jgi:predicted DCC family thiol-disulfide oxidoreductase YuxK
VSGAGAQRYVALYDGDCGFCTRWKERAERRDRSGRIEWVSLHDPAVRTRFPGLDRDDALRRMYVLAPDGAWYRGADGWVELFRVLEGWGWAAALSRLPGMRPLMRRVYGFIAARRDRLSCGGAACRRPPGGAAVTVLLLCLAAAGLCGCGGAAAPDPVLGRLQANADPQAAALVATTLSASGGYDAFRTHHNVEYVFRLQFFGGKPTPQVVTRQLHRLGLRHGDQVYIEDLDTTAPQIVRLDGDTLEVTRSGAQVRDPSQLEFPRAWAAMARRTFLLPWNLLDDGIDLESRHERTPPAAGAVPSGVCDVIRRRRITGPERTPSDDWEDIYVSRLTHLIDRIHDYRSEDHSFRVSIWTDYKTFDGMRVATVRRTYASDASGTLGALEVHTEYDGVRFDAPFDDSIFLPTSPLAASATPE